MTDFIDGLEQDLVAAAGRLRDGASPTGAATARRMPTRTLLIAAALLVLSAGSAAAGTLLALRGSVIPAPRGVPPEQTPATGTAQVTALRAADPEAGAPAWTIRVARSQTGLLCSTVGQVVDGRFGLVGLDGHFRVLDDGVSDSCGAERPGATSLIGARVFDADRRRDVRTVVSGVAGPRLRAVSVDVRGRTRSVPVDRVRGAFVLVLRGYPEDLAIRATLRFASGRREVHDFGRGPGVVLDPAGGPAWRASAFTVANDGRSCVAFRPARQTGTGPVSPDACGDLGNPPSRHGFFAAFRRITPGASGQPIGLGGAGIWGHHPARTAVWGAAGDDIASITIQRDGGRPRRLTIGFGRAFLAVFAPDVQPSSLTLRVRFRDGGVQAVRASTHLLPNRVSGRTP